jgi:hypothetical protein
LYASENKSRIMHDSTLACPGSLECRYFAQGCVYTSKATNKNTEFSEHFSGGAINFGKYKGISENTKKICCWRLFALISHRMVQSI